MHVTPKTLKNNDKDSEGQENESPHIEETMIAINHGPSRSSMGRRLFRGTMSESDMAGSQG